MYSSVSLFCLVSYFISVYYVGPFHLFLLKKKLFILAVLGIHCCSSFSLVVASGGHFLVAQCGFLIVVPSFAVEHGL